MEILQEQLASQENSERSRISWLDKVKIYGTGVLLTLGLASKAPLDVSAAELEAGLCLSYSDLDCDGIRNDYDKRPAYADKEDLDADGIINKVDRDPYIAGPKDADYDSLKNSSDQYPYMPLFRSLNEINDNACSEPTDYDCDGIFNIEDRLPWDPDLIDADADGLPNGYDKFPLVPYVTTSFYDGTATFDNYCIRTADYDCDGVDNGIDPDDYVAEFPDVDGDGIVNKYDAYPYFNYAAYLNNAGANTTQKDQSGKFNLPIRYDPVTRYYAVRTLIDMLNDDSDNDGLKDIMDPYPYTRDWDNDGKDDGSDTQISTNQQRVEDKRQEEKKQDQRRQEQDQVDKRQTEKQEQQRIETKAQERKREEQRRQDERDRQRREEERRREQDD